MREDGLIACEICGRDILVAVATWHECADTSKDTYEQIDEKIAELEFDAAMANLIVCEVCGGVMYEDEAIWHDGVDGWIVPLCPECHAENPTGDCPND